MSRKFVYVNKPESSLKIHMEKKVCSRIFQQLFINNILSTDIERINDNSIFKLGKKTMDFGY